MKIPYSFKAAPGTGSDTCIQLRTAQPLALPGEQTREIYLQAGDTVRFTTALAVIRHFIVDGKKRQITPSPAEREGYIYTRLAKAGFSVQSLTAGEPENVIVRKNVSVNASPILIPVSAIRVTCTVSQAGEAEKALVYGIGRKRIFGFGFLASFSVNADESF
ncbi:type I-E CRISPR-associated protein Cas6/Cse3/CasE [Citrobacter sp. wls619]|uniref:type I-E CRISPR-associated protein Cas6/Cse3/CasE n=1 Tax=Citrobacter sp. wls619 TaxID=2576432 RepID=UPI0014850DE2|nr:type I-E CRISPR-associated protein Cas6/Cse3/CasE [Citrobacter sp. wls619]